MSTRRTAGMTLIEVMIVIVILALAATGATLAFGAIDRTKLRSGCAKIMAASRYAYSRAITTGRTVRVMLDMEAGTLSIQEAEGRVALARMDDPRRDAVEEEGGDGSVVDPWEAAQNRLEQTFQPSFGVSPFGPITNRDGEAMSRYQDQGLGRGVQIVQMILPHEPEPRTEGRGAIYFFPGGQTEHAVIQLGDGDETVYSVEIHPLTGRGRVHAFAFEPEPVDDDADEEDLSEVEDPG